MSGRGRRTDGVNFAGLDALEARLVVIRVVSWPGERGADSPML